MKLFLTSLLLMLSLTTNQHKFYVSVTDIEYNTKNKSIEIISRIFADDFEDVLNKRYGVDISLLPNQESENAEKWIKKYISQKFEVHIPNHKLNINYLGNRYEDDRIYLYIEIKNVTDFEKITVENLILTDLFQEQKNLVHVNHHGEIKSSVLTIDKSSHTFIF